MLPLQEFPLRAVQSVDGVRTSWLDAATDVCASRLPVGKLSCYHILTTPVSVSVCIVCMYISIPLHTCAYIHTTGPWTSARWLPGGVRLTTPCRRCASESVRIPGSILAFVSRQSQLIHDHHHQHTRRTHCLTINLTGPLTSSLQSLTFDSSYYHFLTRATDPPARLLRDFVVHRTDPLFRMQHPSLIYECYFKREASFVFGIGSSSFATKFIHWPLSLMYAFLFCFLDWQYTTGLFVCMSKGSGYGFRHE